MKKWRSISNRDRCRWSRGTTAITHHRACGLDLNDNWALTSKSWSCPACGRSKSEILRLSKRGILLAKLELHHDHMADWIWPRAEHLFGKDWRETAAPGFGEVLDSIQELAIRFTNCLVCAECNSADGKVKRRYQDEIDGRFSFLRSRDRSFCPTSSTLRSRYRLRRSLHNLAGGQRRIPNSSEARRPTPE